MSTAADGSRVSDTDAGSAGDTDGRSADSGQDTATRVSELGELDLADMQRQLEEQLLGGPRRWTRDELAERTGVDLERARRLWIAMGFAESNEPGARMFTDGDVRALTQVTTLVDDGVVEPEMEVSIVRALGQSLSRLAEWEVDLMQRYVVDRLRGAAERGEELDATTVSDEVLATADRLLPLIENLQTYAWRRHLAANAGRAMAGAGDEVGRRTMVVGFADIVGYTRLTRQLDPQELTQLLEHFESATMGVIAERHGWVVKTVGDEVMFGVTEPSDAAAIALELTERIAADEMLPGVRVGMAMGEVLVRFGDAYGSVVNIAARLTSVAKPDTILVDEELADALDGEMGVALRAMRSVRVRGLHRLSPHALRRAPSRQEGGRRSRREGPSAAGG